MRVRHHDADNLPDLPHFIPAYSAETWHEIGRMTDDEVLLITAYHEGTGVLRSGPMAVLVMRNQLTGANNVVDLYVADNEHEAVTELLDYVVV